MNNTPNKADRITGLALMEKIKDDFVGLDTQYKLATGNRNSKYSQ